MFKFIFSIINFIVMLFVCYSIVRLILESYKEKIIKETFIRCKDTSAYLKNPGTYLNCSILKNIKDRALSSDAVVIIYAKGYQNTAVCYYTLECDDEDILKSLNFNFEAETINTKHVLGSIF